MAKGKRSERGPRTKNKPKGGEKKPKAAPELKLTELELERVHRYNSDIARWESERRNLQTQLSAVVRNGQDASKRQQDHINGINKRLGVDIRNYEIQDDGRLAPKKAPQPAPQNTDPPKKEEDKK